MNKIIRYFKKHNGYARMKELKKVGFHPRRIKQLLLEGKIEKVKSGLYKLPEVESSGNYSQGYIDVQKSMPNGVICLISALDYHQLSTINPTKIYVALPNKDKPGKLDYPPTEVFYFRERVYKLGIEEIKTQTGNFKVYEPEKTICDMFRYRNKLGEDTALEGLKTYLRRKDARINKLWDYAIKCRVKTIIEPYLKAMVAE